MGRPPGAKNKNKNKTEPTSFVDNPPMANSESTKTEILNFVERLERLDADAKEVADDKKEVWAEIKGRGHDVKALRRIIAERKRDRDDLEEEEAILDLYRSVLGMGQYASRSSYDDGEDESANEPEDSMV